MIRVLSTIEPPKLELHEGKCVLRVGDEVIEIPKMKHDAVFLTVSNIVTQCAFCEYKLHLDYMQGRKIASFVREGIREHERQLGSAPSIDFDIEPLPGQECPVLINVGQDGVIYFNTVMREKWLLKHRDSKLVVEPAVLVLRDTVPILAQPDMVVLEDSKCTVIELKTTSTSVSKLRPNEILQVQLYGYFLSKLGLDVMLAIVKVKRGSNFVLHQAVDKVLEVLSGLDQGYRYLQRDVAVHRVPLIPEEEAVKYINYALEYWLYKRNPKPSPDKSRCRVCPHVKRCPFKPPLL